MNELMKIGISHILVLTMFSLLACAPVYVPNVRNAALFRGAGEFQGSVHIGEGFDAQSAISITNHIGIMGNYEFVDRNTSDANDEQYIKHKFWEAAAGYYENIDKICYEVFGGYGRGEGTSFGNYSIFGPTAVKATGTYNRIFIQPSIGSNNHIFNWIVSARISYVDFEKFEYDNQVVLYNNAVVFFEPAFTGKVNFGQSAIYSQFQTGFSFTTQSTTVFDYEPFHLSFGLGIRLGGKPKVVSNPQ